MTKLLSIVTTLLLLAVQSSFAQGGDDTYTLFLHSGARELSDNFNDFINNPTISREEEIAPNYYRYLQFFDLPKETDREKLKDLGIELLEYIPDYSYIVSIPTNIEATTLNSISKIRNISPIQTIDKLQAALINYLDQDPPNYIDIKVQHYSNVVQTVFENELQSFMMEVMSRHPNQQALTINIPSSEIYRLAALPQVQFIELLDESYPENSPIKNAHRSNVLSSPFHANRNLTGAGVHIALGDDGFIDPHIDFKARLNQTNVELNSSNHHAESIAGILVGAGNINPVAEGMAKGATLHIQDGFDAVNNLVSLYESEGVVLSSTSFGNGCNRGYNVLAQLADRQIRENPELMHVFSAGNSGTEDCGYGAGAGWGNITGGVKVGKNVLAVGNLDTNNELAYNSSRGPANDGRIKPDITAIGTEVLSTSPYNTYNTISGSSAAAPVVSGILAQLYEAYRNTHQGDNPHSALLKASILNTADDLGNIGPDYSYGWGRINARRALLTLENNHYYNDKVSDEEFKQFTLNIPEGLKQVKLMCYWNDHEGSAISGRSLVNNLDMTLTNPNQETVYPWVLNASPNSIALNQPALEGYDKLNNVEQIVINNPIAGNYTIGIKGALVPEGPQEFFVVYEFISDELSITYPCGGESFTPSETERIHWDAFGNEDSFVIDYSINNGVEWRSLASVEGHLRHYDWTIPTIDGTKAIIRISRIGQSYNSTQAFNICAPPANLIIKQVCPNYTSLQWDPMEDAMRYVVYKLGNKYMDSITTITDHFIDIPNTSPQKENWYAVKAIAENGIESKRTIAISDGTELYECILDNDIKLVNINSPNSSGIKDCFDAPIRVSLNIKNSGNNIQSNIPIYYQLDEEEVIMENYASTLPAGVTVNHTFDTPIIIEDIGLHELKVWADLSNDEARYNDTQFFKINIIPGTLVGVPYFEDFDAFENCINIAVCGNHCNLKNGWSNDRNTIGDQIDWLVNNSETPTDATGPNVDQNTATESGKYLYLEGSSSCYNKAANLLSPCIDLSNTSSPLFSFWYHMLGNDAGRLSVDLFDGENWYNNILEPVIGDQGDGWKKETADLSAFAGRIVNIRFRGLTGDGHLTDIAIDNVAIIDTHTPPISAFTVGKRNSCTEHVFQLSDNSYNTPNAWEWEFSPNTVSFLEGTSDESANPVIQFNQTGMYDIQLTTFNDFGIDSILESNYITIDNGELIPYIENFNETDFPPSLWLVSNLDENTSWSATSAIGTDGSPTTVAYVNNHNYNAINQKDELASLTIDLLAVTEPQLRFDVAYAQYDNTFTDRLIIQLSNDCGDSFEEIIYNKGGQELATVANQTNGWAPQNGAEWRTETIDLSAYTGNSIALKFVNINGYGNNLYLDNIVVYEKGTFPEANFDTYPDIKTICLGESLLFENTSSGNNIDSYHWTFGNDAIPASSDSEGPHTVSFEETGTYTVSLKTQNELGFSLVNRVVKVVSDPIAEFVYAYDGASIVFNNNATWATSYLWDFGDGSTSEEANPIHTYTYNNSFPVKLTCFNDCGEHSSTQTILITTDVHNIYNQLKIDAYPNPASDWLNIDVENDRASILKLSLFDMQGRSLIKLNLSTVNGKVIHPINISPLSSGIYLLKIVADDATLVKRIVINR